MVNKAKFGKGNWPHQAELADIFGNPSVKGWGGKNLVYVSAPFKMYIGKTPIHGFYVHKCCAESITRILNKAWEVCGHSQAKIDAEHISQFSGSWVVRNMRGLGTLSCHAYGLALDFNAGQNPLGSIPGRHAGSFTENSLLVKLFEEEGWEWGGGWSGRKDGMHFQAARTR